MPGRPPARELPEPTIRVSDGWHCLHAYFRAEPKAGPGSREIDRDRLLAALDPDREHAPQRLQTFAVTGHRADLGVMALDPDPLRLDAVLQEVRVAAGRALTPTYSFVSITEVSEYVPTVEQFADRLRREGLGEDDPGFKARVAGYEKRLPAMNEQRLTPTIPDLPVHCFYPMNKIRDPAANWFTLPFSRRSELMAEHATSGIQFAGRVSQLITASAGFDDWEWGVTLWGRNPESIKEIVYTMRFDEASARYAQFGPFFVGYVMPAERCLEHLRV